MSNSKRMLSGFATTAVACAVIAILQTGCEKFTQGTKSVSEFRLPKPEMEEDSVALAIGIAELGPEQKSEFAELVAKADWLDMDLADRRRLDENGLSVALLPRSATEDLNRVLESKVGGTPRTRLTTYRRAESRIGEGIVASVSEPVAQIQWHQFDDGKQTTDQATQAHCAFRIVATPLASDRTRVRLTFTPEVHHGAKKSWIGVEDKKFADTSVIAPTVAMERMGQLFFGPQDANTDQTQEEPDKDIVDLFPMLDQETGAPAIAEVANQNEAKVYWQRMLIVRLVDSSIEL